MELHVMRDVKEIEPEAWDQLSAGHPFSSHRWYTFGQAVLADTPSTYLVLTSGGEPVARAALWLKHREWLPITSTIVRFTADKLIQRWPLLSCETPLVSFSGLILPDSPLWVKALELITQKVTELAKESHALCSLFGYIQPAELNDSAWPKNYTSVSYEDEETVLPIQWPDYNEYFMSLAHSTRRNIRLHGKKADELGITLLVNENVTALEEAISLIGNVESHHGVGHRPWTRNLLQNSGMVDFRWISAWMDDRLVGCCSLLADGPACTATLLGLDYSFSNWIFVYYQLIYRLIRCAIEQGYEKLYGGGGAYELKRRLHFQKLPDDCMMVSPTSTLAGWFVRNSSHLLGSSVSEQANEDAARI